MRGFFDKKNIVLMLALSIFAVLIIAAAGGKYNFPIAQTIITSVTTPVNGFFTSIGSAVNKGGHFVAGIMSTYEENQKLKKEIADLRRANIDSAEIWAENKRLRALLDFKETHQKHILLPAKVVGFNPTGLTGNIIIDKGRKDGIEKDMSVVTADGLVGSVIDVYRSSSRVQLVLHPKSAVGGIVQRASSRVAGIVSGNATTPRYPNLLNLARDADVVRGDIVITSGYGGIYPKGLMIGVVSSVVNAEGGLLKYAVIDPTVNFAQLEEVMVITNTNNYMEDALTPANQQTAGAAR